MGGASKKIWIELDSYYERHLTLELSDGFLAFLYPYGMIHELDIAFEGDISEDILYKFNRQLMPILADNNPTYHRISVKAKAVEHHYEGKFVGCGFSGGVDSFCCLNRNMSEEYGNYKITHLCLFDFPLVDMDCKVNKKRYLENAKKIRFIANEKGMDFLGVQTNINDFYDETEARWVHGAYTVGIMLCLQKGFQKYLMASDYLLAEMFDVRSDFDDHFSFLQLDTFSNNNLRFVYESMDLNRIEKTKYLQNDSLAKRYLNVCGYQDEMNCSICEKCIRTLCTLDILGYLDDFEEVFDIPLYKSNRNKHLARMHGRRKQNLFCEGVDRLYRSKGGNYPIGVYFWSPYFAITGKLRQILLANEKRFFGIRKFYRRCLKKYM